MQVEQLKEGVDVAIKTGNWAQRNPLALSFIVMLFSIGGTWITLNGRIADKDKEMLRITKERDEFKKERDEYKYYVLPKLRELQPTIEATAQKIDSITQK